MFVLSSISGTAFTSFFNWQKAKEFMSSSIGQDFIGGVVAQPVFSDVRKTTEQNLKNDNKTNVENPLKRAFNWFKETFAWGDVFSLTGVGLLIGHHFLVPPDKNDNWIDKMFMWGTGIVSAGGFLLARIGQSLNLHREFVFGEEMCEIIVREYENSTNKKCFVQLGSDDVVSQAKKLEKILAYNQHQSHKITERYDLDQIGGFLSGTFGTGKSHGARLILGKFVEKMGSDKVDIYRLDLDNFEDALKKYESVQKRGREAMKLVNGDLADINIGGNKTLIGLRYMIKRCKQAIQLSKANGKTSAIWIDEWEKIFNSKNLQGCDPEELSRLFVELNGLLEDNYGNILMTSNKTADQLEEELKNIIPPNVLGAFIRRLREVVLELPDSDAQSRIIANYVQESVDEGKLRYEDFNFGVAQISDPGTLAKALLFHSTQHDNYLANGILTPNDIRIVIQDLPGYLTSQKRINQEPDRKISLDDIKNMIECLVSSNKEKDNRKNLRQEAFSTIQHYIHTNADKLKANYQGGSCVGGIGLFKSIYTTNHGRFVANDSSNHAIRFMGDGTVIIMLAREDGGYDEVAIQGDELDKLVCAELAKVLPSQDDPLKFFGTLVKALAEMHSI